MVHKKEILKKEKSNKSPYPTINHGWRAWTGRTKVLGKQGARP